MLIGIIEYLLTVLLDNEIMWGIFLFDMIFIVAETFKIDSGQMYGGKKSTSKIYTVKETDNIKKFTCCLIKYIKLFYSPYLSFNTI